jgi:hypothetical protein
MTVLGGALGDPKQQSCSRLKVPYPLVFEIYRTRFKIALEPVLENREHMVNPEGL